MNVGDACASFLAASAERIMLASVLTGVLQRRLGQFIEIEDGHVMKLSIWKGRVALKNVKLRRDALYTLGLPLSVRSGVIERLSVDIPWRRLGTEPVVIKISGVSVVFGSLDEDAEFDDETLRTWAWRRKQLELQELLAHDGLEDVALAEAEGGAQGPVAARPKHGPAKKRQTGVARFLFDAKKLASKILDHLKVEIERVHARVEDDTHAARPFALGITLDAMTTCRESAAAKHVRVDGLAVYHTESEAGGGASAADAPRSALVGPAQLVVRLQYPPLQPSAAASHAPHAHPISIALEMHELGVRLSQPQLLGLSRMISHTIGANEALQRREVTVLLRDRLHREGLAASPRARFRYAISHVLLELQWRRGWHCSVRFFAERRALRQQYTLLYLRSLRAKLSVADAAEKEAMERTLLSAADIFCFRTLAELSLAAPPSSPDVADTSPRRRRRRLMRFGRRRRASAADTEAVPSGDAGPAKGSSSGGAVGDRGGEWAGAAAAAEEEDDDLMPELTDEQHRVVAALVADDDDDDESSGSAATYDAAAEHTMRLSVESLHLTLSTVDAPTPRAKTAVELLRLEACSLQVEAGFRPGRTRATASLSSLGVLDRSAPAGTLARSLVRLQPGEEGVALQCEWSVGRHDEPARVRVVVPAVVQIAFAPLMMSRLASFFASVSDVHEALILVKLRAYTKRLMWHDAKREDLLEDLAREHKRVDFAIEIAAARLLCSSAPTNASVPLLVVALGETQLRSILPNPAGLASPEQIAAVASASLTADGASASQLDAVRSTLYSRLRGEVSGLRLSLQSSSAVPNEATFEALPSARPVVSCMGGLLIDIESCILPPGSHALVQTRVAVSARALSTCSDAGLAALAARHEQAARVWQQAQRNAVAIERLTPVVGPRAPEWWQPEWWQPRLVAAIPTAPGRPARHLHGAAGSANGSRGAGKEGRAKHDRNLAAQLAAARSAGFTAGVREAMLTLRGDAPCAKLSQQDVDAIARIADAATAETAVVRRTFAMTDDDVAAAMVDSSSASPPTVHPWHTWSPPPTQEVQEAIALFDASAKAHVDASVRPDVRTEIAISLPNFRLSAVNQSVTVPDGEPEASADDAIAVLDASGINVRICITGEANEIVASVEEATVNDCGADAEASTRPSPVIRASRLQVCVCTPSSCALPEVSWEVPELHVGWVRGAVARLLSWRLPDALLQMLAAEPQLASVSVTLGLLRLSLHENSGMPRFAVILTGARILLAVASGSTSGELKSLTIHELGSAASEELFATLAQPETPLVSFELRAADGAGPKVAPPQGMLTGSGRASGGGAGCQSLRLRAQPFLLHGRAESVLLLQNFAAGEASYLHDAMERIGITRGGSLGSDETRGGGSLGADVQSAGAVEGRSKDTAGGAGEGSLPYELDVDIVGATVRLLLDDRDAGLQVTIGRLLANHSAQLTSQGRLQSALTRGAGGAGRAQAAPCGRPTASTGAPPSPIIEDFFFQPSPSDPLTVWLEHLEITTLAQTSPGGVQSTPILREESLMFSLVCAMPAHLRACGDELICHCTEDQVRLLHCLAQSADRVTRSQASGSSSAGGSEAHAAPATSAGPQMRLNVGYRLAMLTLSSARGWAVSNALHDFELEVRLDATGNSWLSVAIGAWEAIEKTRGRSKSHSPRDALLAAKGSMQGAEGRSPHPVLHVEQRISREKADTFLLRFRPSPGGSPWEARLQLLRGRCAALLSCCTLWLPLARIATLLCCCLPAFRRLALVLLGESCSRMCCRRRTRRQSTAAMHPSPPEVNTVDELGGTRDLESA